MALIFFFSIKKAFKKSNNSNPPNNIILLKVIMLKKNKPINLNFKFLYKIPFTANRKKNKIIISGFTRTKAVDNVGSIITIKKAKKRNEFLFIK